MNMKSNNPSVVSPDRSVKSFMTPPIFRIIFVDHDGWHQTNRSQIAVEQNTSGRKWIRAHFQWDFWRTPFDLKEEAIEKLRDVWRKMFKDSRKRKISLKKCEWMVGRTGGDITVPQEYAEEMASSIAEVLGNQDNLEPHYPFDKIESQSSTSQSSTSEAQENHPNEQLTDHVN